LVDHSKEVKEFLRKEGIKVKKAGKERIVEVLKYYDSLKISGRLPG
jgi:predicted Fe-Mo cluster-binding NifX family protein